MKRNTIFLPSAMASWSPDELCKLRQLAHSGTPTEVIAATLERSVSAVRNKAGLHGISLRASAPRAPQFVNPNEAADSECCSLA